MPGQLGSRDAAIAAGFGGRPARPEMRVKFRPYRNPAGRMLGWLEIELPSGLIISDAKLMPGPSGKRWVAMPGVPQTNPNGSPRLINGKQGWAPHLLFVSKAIREKFQEQVLAVLWREHPALFAGAPEQ